MNDRTMNAVDLHRITRRFAANVVAVDGIDLSVPDGAFVTLLGPSGCGKTTTLRMIAGLETPDDGEVQIRGKRMNEVAIHKRNLGMVFQNYALFPHKSIFANVAFGLKYRKVATSEIQKRVKQALDIVRLPGVEERFPSQLSGGQQQRIALARALVIEPDVLLLDEPLSALDANLREEMRVELKNIQRRIGVATVFVTHDQGEALAMSDLVVVMNKGRIEQMGAPADVYEQPRSEFVASFLGNANFLPATVTQVVEHGVRVTLESGDDLFVGGAGRPLSSGEKVRVVVRAEKVEVDGPGAIGVPAKVADVDYLGSMARYQVELRGGQRVLCLVSLKDRALRLGEMVSLRIDPRHCRIL
jgi:putative spermidine/putrescine transport system ATP-binding protein/spermidine/putrescine transport system ATP-binding protein